MPVCPLHIWYFICLDLLDTTSLHRYIDDLCTLNLGNFNQLLAREQGIVLPTVDVPLSDDMGSDGVSVMYERSSTNNFHTPSGMGAQHCINAGLAQ